MATANIHFAKLEALGNDFMLVDARKVAFNPATEQVCMLGDRRRGVGFDQLLILRPTGRTDCLCTVSIYNNDGSKAQQCGNGMRAIALWLYRNNELDSEACLDSASGIIKVHFDSEDRITATLAVPDFTPSAWGFTAQDREWVDSLDGQTIRLHGVSMGNPHVVIPWHKKPDPLTLQRLASRYGQHPALADGANISLARAVDRQHIELAVFERGAGSTPACGSAACAAAAVLIAAGQVDSPVVVEQPGGKLVIHWPAGDQPVEMTGPARLVFHGTLELDPENET